MPWQCPGCAAQVLDDATACPTCGQRKTSWTLVQDRTRTMRVTSKKRFECLRGDWDAPLEAADDYARAQWTPTEVLPVVHADEARALRAQGRLPAPHDVVTVRAWPGTAKDREVALTVLYEGAPARDVRVPGPTGPLAEDGSFDVRVLGVWTDAPEGAPADDLSFEGVHVLDVSEPTRPAGHAPFADAAALRRPPRRLRVQPASAVYRGLMRGLFFETNKAFLLPCATPALRRLREVYEEHPGCEVLVVGHADTTGSDQHNLVLSVERADAMAAYLRDDVERWTGYFTGSQGVSSPWGTREVQWMLSALPEGEGPKFYAGEPTGAQDGATTQATKDFQAWSNATRGTALDEDGVAGPLTRRELVAAYMELDGTSLPPDAVLRTHGCGEFHPAVDTGDGQAEQENRRVEVFFFESPPGTRPLPQPCAAPGCAEYPQWLAAVVETIDLTLPAPACGPLFAVRLPSYFSFARSFPKPSALPGLRAVLAALAADPAGKAVVVGHTDTAGDGLANLALSRSRAETVRALLVGDAAALLARFERADPFEPWDWEEVQWMLSAVPDAAGGPCYAGLVDGHPGRMTEGALGRFQLARGLPLTYGCPQDVLEALVGAYLEMLAAERPAAERVEALGGGSWHAPRPFGPVAAEAEPPPDEARARRRAEVFVGGDFTPPTSTWRHDGKANAAYDRWCDAAAPEPPAPPVVDVVGRVVDEAGRPVSGLAWEVLVFEPGAPAEEPVGGAATDAAGLLRLALPPGLYALRATFAGRAHRETLCVRPDEVEGFTLRMRGGPPRARAWDEAAVHPVASEDPS